MRVGRKRATDVEDLRCDPLVKELLNLCDEQGLAINKVAKKSGVSFQTILRWQNSNIPNLYNFRAVLQSIGYDLKITKDD
jgi:transcriptional regulator with XRE-family HTH domain|tara:strand:+ start:307 stop:546 length:240 start_codon:yes stop_codon:yes gene_type:complete